MADHYRAPDRAIKQGGGLHAGGLEDVTDYTLICSSGRSCSSRQAKPERRSIETGKAARV